VFTTTAVFLSVRWTDNNGSDVHVHIMLKPGPHPFFALGIFHIESCAFSLGLALDRYPSTYVSTPLHQLLLRWGFTNFFLPQLALNCELSPYPPSSQYYRCESPPPTFYSLLTVLFHILFVFPTTAVFLSVRWMDSNGSGVHCSSHNKM
jgi:hypothetical protein